MIIKTHKELAAAIQGKRILHMNSYGKDSVLTLEWLYNYVKNVEIVSVNFKFMAPHPGDLPYLGYLKKRYPRVTFLEEPNPFEVTRVALGVFQSPLETLREWNKFEYDIFDPHKMMEDLRQEFACDYICVGNSRYESFARANFFHKNGILHETKIYPLGFMSKAQVLSLIKTTGFKVHPVYKLALGTLDNPNHYKMRSSFIVHPKWREEMLHVFPMLALDQYRYEVLFK